jgi:hypothetical protein
MEDIPPPLPVQPRLPPPKPKDRTGGSFGKGLLKILVYALLGVLSVGFLSVFLPPTPRIPGSPGLQLIPLGALPFLWFLGVAVHELGHFAGGRLRGGRLLMLSVGPLMWRRTPSGGRFMRNRSLNVMGGLVVCLPDDPAKVTARDTALMFAGGPLASLLLAIAAFGCFRALAIPHGAGTLRALAQGILFNLGLVGYLQFLFNAIPTSEKGMRTDGARFLGLLRGGASAEQEKATLMVSTASLAGRRPSELDPVIVRQTTSLRDASLSDLYGHACLFHHALDTGNAVRAQAILDYVLAHEGKLTPPLRESLRCEYAWLLATHTTDAAAARAWLDSAGKLDWDPATRLRSEAAVLLAEGQPAAAATQARAALVALQQRSISPVQNPYTVELIQQVLARAASAA